MSTLASAKNEIPVGSRSAAENTMSDIQSLQKRWTYLYKDHLPALAKAKDSVQNYWPVQLDHCFARIVLDNAVGIDRPWTSVVKSPAVKNMTADQLEAAIDLAERLATGEANLSELDNQSLDFRGKKRKVAKDADQSQTAKKKQKGSGTVSSYFMPSQQSPAKQESKADTNGIKSESTTTKSGKDESSDIDMTVQIKRIEDSDITEFRKHMLKLLCEIPRGRYSTYKAMSDHVTKTSHKTCARAVGNAMRNNPFAPEVPCHRVLANDGSLGGFKGFWGESGKFASSKHELLYEEGVRFDSRGKVKGPPFREFTV